MEQPTSTVRFQEIDHRKITTTFDLPGSRIVEHLGVVLGITVRSRSIVGTVGASLQTLVGYGNDSRQNGPYRRRSINLSVSQRRH